MQAAELTAYEKHATFNNLKNKLIEVILPWLAIQDTITIFVCCVATLKIDTPDIRRMYIRTIHNS